MPPRRQNPEVFGALAGTLAAVVHLALPPTALPQALCSAPHSSPSLRGGSLGTTAPGSGWLQFSVFRQRSARHFDAAGDRLPFPADGTVGITSMYLTTGVGLIRGLDAWFQVPLHVAGYRDVRVDTSRTGIGDLRAALRVGPALFGAPAIPLAVRVGAKVPGTAFPLDATIIPLTEGQRDWEVSVETGHAFSPLYLLGWVGHRWRGENTTVGRQPGREVFGHAALGGTAGGLHWELASDVLVGSAPTLFGLQLTTARRRLFQLAPTLGGRFGPGDLEATAAIPVVGRNLPTGAGVSLGYRLSWGR
ncbi:MAG: hypothetical protein HY700_12910 [Gemmatimonadetes bacterium]|nr:hypothetical protein [Gemmatimonadota bacterium]